ncbi:unnamed protein product [Psylliodes chrysocephalus]|uniref:Cilia- and flagella-associated protein 161 n=1 Tax=Psylliodes chrysocephalus TaxID=3402493 RepID=A0A9P0D5N4_9CUCU|nr:unnamed protein product [Psylliodes chrysocephala]
MMMKATPLEIDEREKVFQPKIAYSNPIVHVGFWFDEQAIVEDNINSTAYRRDRCELLIQKTRKMYRNILRQTLLAIETPFTLFGEKYQIKSRYIKNKDNKTLCLAGVVNERDIEKVPHFQHGCCVSATSMTDPCVRNTFRIKGASTERDGQQVLFGDDVLLQIVESAGPPLYIQCENHTISTFGLHLVCKLSQDPDIYCRFKFLHGNPAIRNKTLGTPFSPDTKVIIQHSASGQNLAVEKKRLIPTFFGPEIEVTCHSFKDSHKIDTKENYWKIGTRFISDNALYLRAAKGEELTQKELEKI